MPQNPVYLPILLIGPRLHGRCSGDRVQMGRRGWRRSLQRSAPRKCSKGGAQGPSDLFRTEDLGTDAVLQLQASRAQVFGSRVPELRGVRAGERAGFPDTDTVTAGVTVLPAVRPGDTAVVTLDGQPVPGVPASGGQFTISPVDRGTHSIQMVVKDPMALQCARRRPVTFYRSTTFIAIANESRQTTLTECHDALRPQIAAQPGALWQLNQTYRPPSPISIQPICSTRCRPASSCWMRSFVPFTRMSRRRICSLSA